MTSDESILRPSVQQSKSSCEQPEAQLVVAAGMATSLSFVNSKSRNEESSLRAGVLSSDNKSAKS